MKAFLIIIICILYLVACICSGMMFIIKYFLITLYKNLFILYNLYIEIWYLVILHKIGGYDSGIYPGKAYLIYSDTL